jgi:predicted alpha/beta-hydrolase family hydrolase
VILVRPENASAMLALAHGAGAGMRHPFLERLAAALAGEGIATLRYEFPYMASGKKRIDAAPVLEQSVREAVAAARSHGLPLFAGGKSMGGRMTSQAQAHEPLAGVRGIVFVGFPLHPAREPATHRADHLVNVGVPMLFLQGTRDELASLPLLRPIVEKLPGATLHVVEEADHSFHVLKRSGRSDDDVIAELAATIAAWLDTMPVR